LWKSEQQIRQEMQKLTASECKNAVITQIRTEVFSVLNLEHRGW